MDQGSSAGPSRPRVSLIASVGSAIASYTAAARVKAVEQYVPFFLMSLRMIRKICSENKFVALSKLQQSISDEALGVTVVRHLNLIGRLNRSVARAITKRYPHYSNKYVHAFLMKRLSKSDRRAALEFHHRYLTRHLVASFYEEILDKGPILWSQSIGGNLYAVSMSFDPDNHAEGDLSLIFCMNDAPIYVASFSVVPGRLVGCSAKGVLLVARVQGKKHQANLIGTATRACERIAPPYLLLTAVQSIAALIEIDTICGVTNDQHLVKSREEASERVSFDYDAFWETLSFKRRSSGVFELELSHSSDSSPLNRARRQRKMFKDAVQASVRATFLDRFVKPQHDGSARKAA